jgi:hypothetical protein
MIRPTRVRLAILAVAIGLVLRASDSALATELTKEELSALLNGSATSVDLDNKDPDKPVIGFDIYPKGGNADGALAKLKVCKKVHKAVIQGKSDVTDKGLECLKDMTEMEDLRISGSKFTEKGLANLKGMTKLKKLELAVPDTGEGLSFLKECKELKYLRLTGTKITDEGFANLKELKSLEELNLSDTSLDDKSIANLTGLTDLKKLTISRTKITSASATSIKELKGLEELYASQPGGKLVGKKIVPTKEGLDDKAAGEIKKALTNLKKFDRF